MRRALLATFALFLLAAAPAAADTNDYLDSIRGDAIAIDEFMRALPKGADLHSHLSGAVYAESMVEWGAADGRCVSTVTYTASAPPCVIDQRPISDALTDNVLYNNLLAAWSMRGFVPGDESGHDHFFATFDKFSATQSIRKGDALAEVATRAASQDVHYLELLYTPQFGATRNLSSQVNLADGFAASRDALLAAGIENVVPAANAEIDAIFAQFNEELACGTPDEGVACDLPIRFDFQGLRANAAGGRLHPARARLRADGVEPVLRRRQPRPARGRARRAPRLRACRCGCSATCAASTRASTSPCTPASSPAASSRPTTSTSTSTRPSASPAPSGSATACRSATSRTPSGS